MDKSLLNANIFMPYTCGNLETIEEQCEIEDEIGLANDVLRQMLHALKFLHSENVTHGGVKPSNILWNHGDGGGFDFLLSEFEVIDDYSKQAERDFVGIDHKFIPPEISSRFMSTSYRKSLFRRGENSPYDDYDQITKIDIWCLFSVIVWILNKDYRTIGVGEASEEKISSWLLEEANKPRFSNIKSMASSWPSERPDFDPIVKKTI